MHRIAVKPGGLIVSIYTDAIPWQKAGTPMIARAGHVEYDNERHGWTVTIVNGPALHTVHRTREEALSVERSIVSMLL